jgi:hypothetical protein
MSDSRPLGVSARTKLSLTLSPHSTSVPRRLTVMLSGKSSTGANRFNDEFAGATFSPDGHTLFVNIQAGRGLSFAIWGPWQSIGV